MQRDICGNKIHILGAVVKNNDNAAIFYNIEDKVSSHRCRFTIAHELAHCCLAHDSGDVYIDYRTDGETLNEEEQAANAFAGELLIPEQVLRTTINGLVLPSVKSLWDIFDVSENVMRARLEYLRIQDRILGYNY